MKGINDSPIGDASMEKADRREKGW